MTVKNDPSIKHCPPPRAGAGAMVGGAYRPSGGRIWLDDVNCTGVESSLTQCAKSDWGIHDCTHQEDAAVLCPSGQLTPFKFKFKFKFTIL